MKQISDADFAKVKRLLGALAGYERITNITLKTEYRRQASLLLKKLTKRQSIK